MAGRQGGDGSVVFVLGGELERGELEPSSLLTNEVCKLTVRAAAEPAQEPRCESYESYSWSTSVSHRIARGGHAAAVHEGQIVAFGGRSADGELPGDEWASLIASVEPGCL